MLLLKGKKNQSKFLEQTYQSTCNAHKSNVMTITNSKTFWSTIKSKIKYVQPEVTIGRFTNFTSRIILYNPKISQLTKKQRNVTFQIDENILLKIEKKMVFSSHCIKRFVLLKGIQITILFVFDSWPNVKEFCYRCRYCVFNLRLIFMCAFNPLPFVSNMSVRMFLDSIKSNKQMNEQKKKEKYFIFFL